MEKGNPEYLVSYVYRRASHMDTLTVYEMDSPITRQRYQVRAEPDVLARTYKTLFAIMDLAGEKGTGGFSVILDRESILAVVPEWEKIL